MASVEKAGSVPAQVLHLISIGRIGGTNIHPRHRFNHEKEMLQVEARQMHCFLCTDLE
jgi:hypothetical protein